MPQHGKKHKAAVQLVERRPYQPDEAIQLVKQTSYSKFDGTVEVHMHLGVDPRHADQQVRGVAALPAGSGKVKRVIVFAQGDRARDATEGGALAVGSDDLVKRITDGWLDFDVAIATPDQMPKISRLGRLLGPRGLMPNPKTGTVTDDVAGVLRDISAGRVDFRVDRTSGIHAPIGKVSFEDERIKQNLSAFISAIVRAKPSGARGQYIRSVAIASTMGPGIDLDLQAALALVAN
jgi:large subunit ribosomal protein L1